MLNYHMNIYYLFYETINPEQSNNKKPSVISLNINYVHIIDYNFNEKKIYRKEVINVFEERREASIRV